jgi:Spy/CpxP family protein refolding chaperone
MKRIISVFLSLVMVAGMMQAQNNNKQDQKRGNNDWRERVRAEQVAFITSELDLTETEAQVFWPVYNDVQKQRRQAFQATGEAFKALTEGLDGNNADALLDKYLDAKKAGEKVEAEAVARYKKVLPVSKVAKLLLAEEKFRQNQIHRLGQGGPGRPGGAPGNRPGGPGNRPQPSNEPSTK